MALALQSAIGSDVGQKRAGNQDSAAAGKRLVVVADGMGGHAHGELASAMTVAALDDMDDQLPETLTDVDLVAALTAGLVDASHRLDEGARRDPGARGMGTTAVAMLVDDTRLGILHIGDSRIYRLRDGEFSQVTHDHTVVQALVDEGRITPEEAAVHPRRSVLLRALQAGHEPDPEVWLDTVALGDRYLLCSDGVTAVLPDSLLHDLLAGVVDAEEVVREIITLANEGGGPDNITCIVTDVVDGPPADGDRVLAGAAAEQQQTD